MSSALTIAVKTLLASSNIVSVVTNRVYPVYPPQNHDFPQIVVSLVSGAEETLLQGASEWPDTRITIDCRASSTGGTGHENPVPVADRLAETVIEWLRDKHLYQIDGCEVTFQKEGTDETDISENAAQNGIPIVVRRYFDYYLRFRKLP